jgi:hypothetical protein
MKLKLQIPETIDFYCEYVEVQFETKVKCIHSNRVKEEEYGNSIKIYLKRGIEHSMTVANTPAHNRVERKIGSISNLTRCMLLHSKLLYSFWGEAFAYATRIENYLSTSSIEESISPWQALYKTKPDISKFRVFGCRAQMLIEGKHLKKFDSRIKEVIYLGLNLDSVSGYWVWDPNTWRISVSRSVCFFEDTFTLLPFITRSPFSFSVDPILYISDKSDSDEEFLVRNSENENNILQIPDNVVKPRITFRIDNEVLNPEQSENENDVSQKSVEELKPQITIRDENEIINPKSDNQEISSSTISLSLPSSSSSTNSDQSNSNSNSPDIQTEITERRRTTPLSRVMATNESSSTVSQWKSAREQKPSSILHLIASERSITFFSLISRSISKSVERSFLSSSRIPDPRHYYQAIHDLLAAEWSVAMDTEYNNAVANNTWILVPHSTDEPVVPANWTFKTKYGVTRKIEKLKARIVAERDHQTKRVDYHETYTPVSRMSSLCVLMAVAAHENFEVRQIDVDSAFLNGLIDTEIYMEQPTGYIDKRVPNHVYLLLKSLYGLKQASRI